MERLAPEEHDSLDGVPDPSASLVLVGHAAQVSTLTTAYRAGKLPHALILAGRRGIGKATFAFHLAHHLLRHPRAEKAPEAFLQIDPTVPLYRQVASGAHPSLLHLTRPLNDKGNGFKTVVSVDEIRRVGHFLSRTAHDGGYRVVIVDPADDMNRNAANALLKNLEEPPARTLFVLISHSLGRLLPTIRSRCQTVRLSPLADADVIEVMDAFDFGPPADAAEREAMLRHADGSPRDAVLMTEYGGGEISGAMDKLVALPRVAAADAHKLADAVAGRDRSIQFGLFNDHALELLSDAARQAAMAGETVRADRIAGVYEMSRVAIVETETYNLDRKQHALSMINRLNDAFRM
ncbi:MAG: DNA polymerase III subunit delta' [Rhizobiaceae bacterium]|nr:DNA polymerase III subunit delta' [Rhizobiaceae bacterium]